MKPSVRLALSIRSSRKHGLHNLNKRFDTSIGQSMLQLQWKKGMLDGSARRRVKAILREDGRTREAGRTRVRAKGSVEAKERVF